MTSPQSPGPYGAGRAVQPGGGDVPPVGAQDRYRQLVAQANQQARYRDAAAVGAAQARGRKGHFRWYERVLLVGVASLGVVVVLASLPWWLLLIVAAGVALLLRRIGAEPLRRVGRSVGRFLLFDSSDPQERTGVAAAVTHRMEGRPRDENLMSWVQRGLAAGRPPSPAKICRHYPDADPQFLAAYERDYAAWREKQVKGRTLLGLAFAGQGVSWLLGKHLDSDGTRRHRQQIARENRATRQRDDQKFEIAEMARRINKSARRRGW